MKTSRAFALGATALVIGFLAARWCAAQSARQPSKEPATDSYIALHQLESFVAYLQDTKQTNTLQRFNEYSTVNIASQNSADLGVTLAILQRLRDGRTNEALELLEGRVSTDIVGFVASYRELPASLRAKISLKPLEYARDYRAKFPFKHRYPNVDEGVADAFKILDEKATK
jgi:hypothetical protein